MVRFGMSLLKGVSERLPLEMIAMYDQGNRRGLMDDIPAGLSPDERNKFTVRDGKDDDTNPRILLSLPSEYISSIVI